MNKNEDILSELEEARKEIKTDHYQMSIGEIISLYKDGDLKLNPAYQRLFRWEDSDKTRFIESLILGIPIPPIFVAQKEDGKWDIVDGLQRISTILQLTGDLVDSGNDDKKYPVLKLSNCKYIPSIEGSTWDTLPTEVVRLIKRSRISISIILTENSIRSQYELFQRLNTGGIHLSNQEIRNCLIIMMDKQFYEILEDKKNNADFLKAIKQKPNKISEEIGMELILRYLIAKHDNYGYINTSTTLFSDFVDDETLNLIKDDEFDLEAELDLLMDIIKKLNHATKNNTFIKYNVSKNKFFGPFSVSSFEVLLPGIASNWENIKKMSDNQILQSIKDVQTSDEFLKAIKVGTKGLKRFFVLRKVSIDHFGKY